MTTSIDPTEYVTAMGWIVEQAVNPTNTPPYFTLKPEVAAKRKKAGDYVTPYYSQKPIQKDDDEAL